MVVDPDQLKIVDESNRIVALAMIKDSGRFSGENGQIVFHCYEDRSFLAEVWPPNHRHGRELFTSRTEAELAKDGPGKYFTVLAAHPRN